MSRTASHTPSCFNTLVDFDNAAQLGRLGRLPHSADVEVALRVTTQGIIDCLQSKDHIVNEVAVRLYGGWHDADTDAETDLYHMLSRAVRNHPRLVRGMRLRIRLALAPAYTSGEPFRFTVRTRRKPPSIHFRNPENCSSPPDCTFEAAKRWLRKGCPTENCRITSEDVFWTREQKTIDTTMVSDMIYLATNESHSGVVVVSDDDDMVPGLLYASQLTRPVVVLRRRAQSVYDHLLELHDVLVQTNLPDVVPRGA